MKVTLNCSCGCQKTITRTQYVGRFPNRAVAYSQQKFVNKCPGCGRMMEPDNPIISPVDEVIRAANLAKKEQEEMKINEERLAKLLLEDLE